MKWKVVMLLCLVVGLLLVGCQSNQPPTGYYTYGQQGAQQQGQYVGGGCGLAGADGNAVDVTQVAAAA
jgi:uncharacterized lipoprotein YmbA